MPTGGVYFSPCVSPGLNIGVSEPPTPVTNVPRRGHPCVSAPLPPAAGSCVLPRGRPCPWCHWALPIPLPTGGHLCSSQLVCSCPLRCVCLCPMAGSLPHSASGGVGLTTSIRGDISHTERQDTCSTLLTSPHALGQQTHACGRPGSHPGWLHTTVCTQSQTHWGPTRSHLPKWSVTWSVSITATLGASWAHTCHQSSSHSQSPPKSQTAAPFTGCVFGHRGDCWWLSHIPIGRDQLGPPYAMGVRSRGRTELRDTWPLLLLRRPAGSGELRVCREASGGAHGPRPRKEESQLLQPFLNVWALRSQGARKELGDHGGSVERGRPGLGGGGSG